MECSIKIRNYFVEKVFLRKNGLQNITKPNTLSILTHGHPRTFTPPGFDNNSQCMVI